MQDKHVCWIDDTYCKECGSNMAQVFEYEDVVLALKRIVAEKGEDYVYKKVITGHDSRCVYFDKEKGQPSCLVGHFMYQEGLLTSAEQFDPFEDDNAAQMVRSLVEGGKAYFGQRSEMLLNLVQAQQDSGHTWGNSLEYAIERVEMRFN
jgi:hypothetical protein